MSKRKAATDLNHDNWDCEEEPEVAGTFQEASKEVVQERVIRTAKRRLHSQAGVSKSSSLVNNSKNESKKLFSGFSGFGAVKSSVNPTSVAEMAKNSFSFLKNSESSLKKSDTNMKSSNTPLKSNSSGPKNANEKDDANQKYLAKLRGLNEAVLDWIKKHVESRPCCILTPVFKDYDNYLKEIQNEKDKYIESTKLSSNSSDVAKTSTPPTFSLGSSNSNKEEQEKSSTFSFGLKDSSETKPVAPSFNFGSKTATDSPSFSFTEPSVKSSVPPFLFTTSNTTTTTSPTKPSFGLISSKTATDSSEPSEKKPLFTFASSNKTTLDVKFPSVPPGGNFTFSGINKPAEQGGENENEDDEEPQPEPVKPVTEDDALYTQRVKVFVKKGDGYSDLGVGNLFIKEAPNGWHQAIVRNETSLGNIIFNILLSEQQPTQRIGKNNVMIVCQPTPQHSGPALPVLLRVKTSDDADKLLQVIDKYKKK